MFNIEDVDAGRDSNAGLLRQVSNENRPTMLATERVALNDLKIKLALKREEHEANAERLRMLQSQAQQDEIGTDN